MDTPLLSVLIPALDEEGRIGATVAAVYEALVRCGISHEVIVVDDGSRDHTAREAQAAGATLLRHASTQGKGAAIMTGMAASSGELVAFIDADRELPPEKLPDMVVCATAAGRDRTCVVAQKERDLRPAWERATSALARRFATVILGVGVKDVQTGLKLFPGWFARSILTQVQERGWMWDAEALLLVRQRGLTVIGLPIVVRSVRRRRAGLGSMAAAGVSLLRVLRRRGETGRVLRSMLVGGVDTMVDALGFLALVVMQPPGRDALLSGVYSAASWLAAGICCYFLPSRLPFRSRLPTAEGCVVALSAVAVQTGLAAVASHLEGTGGALVGKLAGMAISAALAYPAYRWLAGSVDAGRIAAKCP